MAVKERHQATDNMFEPLKQTIELLKCYGQEMPEDVSQKLQVMSNVHVIYKYTVFKILYLHNKYMYMYSTCTIVHVT